MKQSLHYKILRIITAVVATVGLAFLVPLSAVHAQSSGGAQGVRLSPAIIDLNGAKGMSYPLNIDVTNVTASDLEYTVALKDFGAKDETGSPQILNDSQMPPQVSMRTWISTVPKFTLASKKTKKVTVYINIPANAEPGGHYGVIQFSGKAPNLKSSGVGISASAGTLLLVKVAGAITEKASVASFNTELNGKSTNFFETAPVNLVTRIQNTGNVHVKPFGSIEVKDMFGSVVGTYPVNSSKSNVLPNSIRRFDNKVDGMFIGVFTATLTLGYGLQGQALEASTTFYVIPYKIIGTVILVIALVIFILRRVQKSYNKRVIKKYKNQQKNNDSKK